MQETGSSLDQENAAHAAESLHPVMSAMLRNAIMIQLFESSPQFKHSLDRIADATETWKQHTQMAQVTSELLVVGVLHTYTLCAMKTSGPSCFRIHGRGIVRWTAQMHASCLCVYGL